MIASKHPAQAKALALEGASALELFSLIPRHHLQILNCMFGLPVCQSQDLVAQVLHFKQAVTHMHKLLMPGRSCSSSTSLAQQKPWTDLMMILTDSSTAVVMPECQLLLALHPGKTRATGPHAKQEPGSSAAVLMSLHLSSSVAIISTGTT